MGNYSSISEFSIALISGAIFSFVSRMLRSWVFFWSLLLISFFSILNTRSSIKFFLLQKDNMISNTSFKISSLSKLQMKRIWLSGNAGYSAFSFRSNFSSMLLSLIKFYLVTLSKLFMKKLRGCWSASRSSISFSSTSSIFSAICSFLISTYFDHLAGQLNFLSFFKK